MVAKEGLGLVPFAVIRRGRERSQGRGVEVYVSCVQRGNVDAVKVHSAAGTACRVFEVVFFQEIQLETRRLLWHSGCLQGGNYGTEPCLCVLGALSAHKDDGATDAVS